jgi:hypothetical protein
VTDGLALLGDSVGSPNKLIRGSVARRARMKPRHGCVLAAPLEGATASSSSSQEYLWVFSAADPRAELRRSMSFRTLCGITSTDPS